MELPTVCRTREIRGFEIPGIIHNGDYYLTDLRVFADGLINCWRMVDLPLFKKKLRSGWVVTSIPENSTLNIHGLGSIKIVRGHWSHTPRTLIKYIRSIIKELNPRLENLYNCHSRETEVINGVRYAAVDGGNPRPWKTKEPISPLVYGMFGSSLRHFEVRGGVYYLVNIQMFKDDTVLVYGGRDQRTLNYEDFKRQLDDPDYFKMPEPGSLVVIKGLVDFTAGEWTCRIDEKDRAAEFHDVYERIHGRPGAIGLCVEALKQYMKNPTMETLDELREKYESVPSHLRMYCGDMDTKDIPIRMILYGEDEIKNWSHYQIAVGMGEQPPTITVPKAGPEDHSP